MYGLRISKMMETMQSPRMDSHRLQFSNSPSNRDFNNENIGTKTSETHIRNPSMLERSIDTKMNSIYKKSMHDSQRYLNNSVGPR